jgi:hypothetical protein
VAEPPNLMPSSENSSSIWPSVPKEEH